MAWHGLALEITPVVVRRCTYTVRLVCEIIMFGDALFWLVLQELVFGMLPCLEAETKRQFKEPQTSDTSTVQYT